MTQKGGVLKLVLRVCNNSYERNFHFFFFFQVPYLLETLPISSLQSEISDKDNALKFQKTQIQNFQESLHNKTQEVQTYINNNVFLLKKIKINDINLAKLKIENRKLQETPVDCPCSKAIETASFRYLEIKTKWAIKLSRSNKFGFTEFTNGDFEYGIYKKEVIHGPGVKLQHGNIYAGFYKKNKFISGQAKPYKSKLDTNEIACGEFVNDKMNGWGMLKTQYSEASSIVMLGEFKDGAPHGRMNYYTGEIFFHGNILKDMKQGFGYETASHGVFVGNYLNHKRHGFGRYIGNEGYEWSGTWEEGKQVETKPYAYGKSCPLKCENFYDDVLRLTENKLNSCLINQPLSRTKGKSGVNLIGA